MLFVDDVTAGYGAVDVLRGVTLAVPDASVVALVGPNGAGKTTLLRVVAGLLKPTTGDLILDDARITGQSPEHLARRGVCHIGEGRAIFRSMSVRENLRLFAPRGDENLAERAITAFPILGRRLNQVAGTLSGGEQQMLALSRVHRPGIRLILLDEVSMGLAPKIVDEIFDFLGNLSRTGVSLLLVEQYVERALNLADLLFVLNKGRVVFAGEPVEVDQNELFDHYMSAAG